MIRHVDAVNVRAVKAFSAFRSRPRAAHAGPSRDVHGSYAVYYKPFPDAVVIIRIIHGARDIAALTERGEFT